MKQLPEEQRPYEKCFTQGADVLSDSELLAVILRSGTHGKNSIVLAQEILKFMEETSYSGLMGLIHVSVQDLMKIHGIGQVKAVQLKCIFLDCFDLFDYSIHCFCHLLVHCHWVVAFNEVWFPAAALEEAFKFFMRKTGEDSRVADLISV